MTTTQAPAQGETYSKAYQDRGKVQRYEKDIYKPGGFDDVLWQVEQRAFSRLLRAHCPGHETKDALDFACGTGRILQYLRPRVGTLVGVDISPAMLEQAAKKVSDVRLVCADIVNHPEEVPGDKDLITSFRFLLLAEPALREACIAQLVKKLRGPESVMVLGLHGNPMSRRALASWRNKLFTPSKGKVPMFGMRDMRALADRVGLRIVATAGVGYVPRGLSRLMPRALFEGIERLLGDKPGLWRFGSNLIVVCVRA